MTTRDIGGTNFANPEATRIAGNIYYQLAACDGWSSGPCLSPAKAIERITAYERCEEISEAAPGQASRAQMKAFLAWATTTAGFTTESMYGRDIGDGARPPHVAELASIAI